MKNEMAKNTLLNILQFLVVMLMCMLEMKLGKIDNKARTCLFISYEDGIKGYNYGTQ